MRVLEYYVGAYRHLAGVRATVAKEVPMSAAIFDAEAAAAEVARALVSTQTVQGRAYITTPITYPTGSHVIVRLDGMGDRWFVSDDGCGSLEAELMNAMATFRRVAPQVAERAGVAFDRRALFVVEATRSELSGAVVSVANATAEAVRRTAMRVEEIHYAASRALFDERVHATFRDETIIQQPTIAGISGRQWEFSAGIERSGAVIMLLDLVRPRPHAVYATVSKFIDVRPTNSNCKGAAILADVNRTDPHLVGLLSRVAGVAIPAAAPESEWREQLAIAA
jgi:hypothetical protein